MYISKEQYTEHMAMLETLYQTVGYLDAMANGIPDCGIKGKRTVEIKKMLDYMEKVMQENGCTLKID